MSSESSFPVRMRRAVCLVGLLWAAILGKVNGQGLKTGTIPAKRPEPNVAYFELVVTLGKGAPACGTQRDVILVNNMFMPTLEAYVNDTIVVNVFNQLPASFPQTSSGITLHWHGLSMWDNATWYDGVSYVTQCPFGPGTNYTYQFKADDAPGTYFWHDHSTQNRADGLMGTLILSLHPKSGIPNPFKWAKEHVLTVTDWWDEEANVMAMRLNRPFDGDKVTQDSGQYMNVGAPDALLINGKGNMNDCSRTQVVAGVRLPEEPPVCNVSRFSVPSRANFSGCSRAEWLVAPGKTYLFRLINAAASVYVSICFEGHAIDLVTADGTPVDGWTFRDGCININSGQRYDVAVTTSNKEHRAFWVSVYSQFRRGGAAAFGVMRYAPVKAGTLPTTPTPVGSYPPWQNETFGPIVTHEGVMGTLDNYKYWTYWNLFLHRGIYSSSALYYDLVPNKTVVLNMTMPLMQETGMVRWAMNNIAMPSNPPCQPLLKTLKEDPDWLKRNTVPLSTEARARATKAILGVSTISSNSTDGSVYNWADPAPIFPAVGMHVVNVEWGEVVDVVMNNLPASSNNGDYRNVTRSFMEQHPMHMHGHKFWVLGMGEGVYNHELHYKKLNLYNPMLRDTVTLYSNSWVVIRFLANNAGVWPLHCHIMWHSYMGQNVYFAEALDRLPAVPKNLPQCSSKCISNFAPYNKAWLNSAFPKTRFKLPDDY